MDTERAGIDELREEARASGDERRQEITDQVADERRLQLDLMPPDLGRGRFGPSRSTSSRPPKPGSAFDELMDKLRQQLMQSYFNQDVGGHAEQPPPSRCSA